MGCCQGSPRRCESGLQSWMPKSFQSTRYHNFCNFFKTFSKTQITNKFWKLKVPNPVVGCQSTLKGCESCLQLCLLKLCSFRDMTFFSWFFKSFQKFKCFFFYLKFSVINLGSSGVFSGVANLACKYDCSNLCSFPNMTFFVMFQNFQKIFFFFKIWNS